MSEKIGENSQRRGTDRSLKDSRTKSDVGSGHVFGESPEDQDIHDQDLSIQSPLGIHKDGSEILIVNQPEQQASDSEERQAKSDALEYVNQIQQQVSEKESALLKQKEMEE